MRHGNSVLNQKMVIRIEKQRTLIVNVDARGSVLKMDLAYSG